MDSTLRTACVSFSLLITALLLLHQRHQVSDGLFHQAQLSTPPLAGSSTDVHVGPQFISHLEDTDHNDMLNSQQEFESYSIQALEALSHESTTWQETATGLLNKAYIIPRAAGANRILSHTQHNAARISMPDTTTICNQHHRQHWQRSQQLQQLEVLQDLSHVEFNDDPILMSSPHQPTIQESSPRHRQQAHLSLHGVLIWAGLTPSLIEDIELLSTFTIEDIDDGLESIHETQALRHAMLLRHANERLAADAAGLLATHGRAGRELQQIGGTALNAVSGIVQRNIEFNCSALSGLEACAFVQCADVFSLVRTADGSVVCRLTAPQAAAPSAVIIVQPYAYDYFFNFIQNVALFGYSAGNDFQNVMRARAREPTGDDLYNYNVHTFNARTAIGSFLATDWTDVQSTDTPFVSLGVNTVQPFTYNTRISPFTGIYTNIRRQGAPGFTTSLPLVTLPNAQYTVFGNAGLPWLP